VGKSGHFKFINKEGKLAFPGDYTDGQPFSEGLAAVQQGKLWGFIDKNGKWVIKPQYKWAYKFTEGLAAVQP
jgi:hypothetical protein